MCEAQRPLAIAQTVNLLQPKLPVCSAQTECGHAVTTAQACRLLGDMQNRR